MSSKKPIAIAVILSLLLIGGLGGLFFFVLNDDGDDFNQNQEQNQEVVDPTDNENNKTQGQTNEDQGTNTPKVPLTAKQRLVVKVMDELTGSLIRGSHIVINKAEDEKRAGEQVYPPASARRARRGGTGQFEVQLQTGTYLVLAQATGFQTQRETITILEGKDANLEIKLGSGLSISGRVMSAKNKQPISGAIIRAYKKIGKPDDDPINRLIGLIEIKEQSQQAPAETTSNTDGTYQIDGLDPVHYDVVALAMDHSPLTRTWIRPSKTGVDFPLPEGSIIRGKVMDIAGVGIEGARVQVFPEIDTEDIVKVVEHKARPPLVESITGSNGAYEIRSIGQGVYNILVKADGFQPKPSYKHTILPGENPEQNFTLPPGLVIAGEVIDEEGQPIVGAKVRPMKMADPKDRRAPININFDDGRLETDENGAFNFDSLIAGGYNLLVWHDDYAAQQIRRVQVGTTTLRVTLKRGGSMSGRVLIAGSNEPVEGARVLVTDLMDVKKEGLSDKDGFYQVHGLSTKKINTFVSVQAKGFARLSNQKVKIPKDSNLENQDFLLQPTAIVIGMVVDGSGNPITGARVTAKRPNPTTGYPIPAGADISNEDGKFAIKVDAGEGTTLYASTARHLETSSEAFTIKPGEKFEAPNLVLTLGATVEGIVVAHDGTPVQGVMVKVRAEGETEFGYGKGASTNRQGKFTLNGLGAGTFDLQGTHSRFLDTVKAGVKIEEGLITSGIRIVMERGNALGGIVQDGEGQPVQGATIIVKEFFEGIKEHRKVTDNEGRFLLESLRTSDPVSIEVTHRSFKDYLQEEVAINRTDLEIKLERLGAITGTVLGAGGAPLTNFSVKPTYIGDPASAPSRSRQEGRSFSVPNGTFNYEGVSSGAYKVSISAPGYAALVIDEVQVATGESVNLGELNLPEGGIIDGIIVDATTGQALPGVKLKLGGVNTRRSGVSRSSAPKYEMQTKPDGTFIFKGLPDAASISMRVELDGYINQTLTKINTLDASTCRNLRIEMGIGGEITGIVTDADGNAKKGVSVYLGGLGGLRGKTGVNRTTRTDGEGNFRIEGLRPGTYRISARARGVKSPAANNSSLEVQVLSGNALSVELIVD